MTIIYPTDDMIHIYSIHAWKYGERRKQLHDLLGASWTNGVDYHDLSVPVEHPLDGDNAREIGYELIDRIQKSDVVLILAGMYLIDRFWMEFEIVVAFVLGKPIIPVAYNGQINIPDMARRFMSCEEPVRWRSTSVNDEILAFMSDHRQRAFQGRRQRAVEIADMVAALAAAPAPLPRRNAFSGFGALETPPVTSLFDLPPALPRRRSLFDWADTGAPIEPPPSPLLNALADALAGFDPLAPQTLPTPPDLSWLDDLAPSFRPTPNVLADALGNIDPLAPTHTPAPDLSWLDGVLNPTPAPPRSGMFGALGRSGR